MKWHSYKIGKLKVAIGEKRAIHACNSRSDAPGTNIVGEYIAFYYKGTQKFAQIVKIAGN